jgi:hypothetical protein
MVKVFFTILISFVLFSSCHKMGPFGCDPGPKPTNTKFDVGFYRGPDMRPEADYVAIDGGTQTLIPSPEGSGTAVTCSTSGILHYSLPLGTHTITIYFGANSSSGTSHTLVLSKNGATLDGTQLAGQSCNSGLSAVIEDI